MASGSCSSAERFTLSGAHFTLQFEECRSWGDSNYIRINPDRRRRLPVPSLWLDIFQKIRSMGYTGVSFYVDWALLEGKPGNYSANGVFDLEPFMEAAQKAGIYLLAVRPLPPSLSPHN